MAEVTVQAEQLNKAIRDKKGKYLTFALANEEYGLEILKVREIIGYMEITAVPQTPVYVKGVINLRGQVIPVVDLRAKFGMETTDVTEQTCIIVVETSQGSRNFSTGIVVDHVEEVLDIAGEDIEEAPQFGSAVNTDFILGMGKIGDSVKILLDIDKVLNGMDFGSFAGDSTKTSVQQESPATDEQAKEESSATDEQAKEESPATDEQTKEESPVTDEQAKQESPDTDD